MKFGKTYPQKKRLSIDLTGNWRLYTNVIPAGGQVIGTVDRGSNFDRGALVLIKQTGLYVQINAGCVRNLPHDEVVSAIAEAEKKNYAKPHRN